MNFEATAGDAMFEPESVCDKSCKEQWMRYGDQGRPWVILAGACFLGAVAAGVSTTGMKRRDLS
jgi:hypothetical protein